MVKDLYKPLGDIAARAEDRVWENYFASGELKPRVQRSISVIGGVAIVPIQSVIMRGSNGWGTDPDMIRRVLSASVKNDKVKSILLDVDSPGGEIRGVELASQAVHEANKVKPVVALTNDLNASAAIWISLNAGKVYSTRDGYTGSHGVIWTHYDQSKMLEDYGIKVTFVSAGKFKVEGNPFESLSQEAREFVQSRVNGVYDEFTNALARGRNKSTAHILEHFGQGRVLTAKQAAEVGMIDGIVEADQILGKMIGTEQMPRMTAVDKETTTEFLAQISGEIDLPENEENGNFALYQRKLKLRERELQN